MLKKRQKTEQAKLKQPTIFFLIYLLNNKIKPQHKFDGSTRNKKTMHVVVWKIITHPYYRNSINNITISTIPKNKTKQCNTTQNHKLYVSLDKKLQSLE
jgi:hypothetical protein